MTFGSNMKSVLLTLAMLLSTAAFGADPSYSVLKITSIEGATIDENGNANFVIEYLIQPCAQEFVKYLEAEVSPLPATVVAGNAKYFSVGVLVMNRGIECLGPVVKKRENYQISAPLPMGGAVLYPISGLPQARSGGYRLASPESAN